jgi:hypothetical protein
MKKYINEVIVHNTKVIQMNTECMIKQLKKLHKNGIKIIEVYYAEVIEDKMIWSVDLMNNYLNDACQMAWTWTIISGEEDRLYREEYKDADGLADYEIVVYNEPFSDDVLCRAVKTWLIVAGLEDYGFEVKMIKLEDVTPYTGYVKNLDEMDFDAAIESAIPLSELDFDELDTHDSVIYVPIGESGLPPFKEISEE